MKYQIKKGWIYIFYIATFLFVAGLFCIYIQPDQSILDKTGPFFVPFILFLYLCFSWFILKKSDLPGYINEKLDQNKKIKFLKAYGWEILFMLLGVIMIFSGDGYLYYVPMRGEHIGSVFFFWGLLSGIYKYFLLKSKRDHGNTIVICENCSKKYKLKHLSMMRCSLCNGNLIRLNKSLTNK